MSNKFLICFDFLKIVYDLSCLFSVSGIQAGNKKKKKVFQEYQDAQQPVMSLNLLMKPTRWEKRPSRSITLDQSYYMYATS